MIQIHPKVYVGSAHDYETCVKGKSGWAVVQVCKEPYHRQALGYKGRAASKNHPDYLRAYRKNRMIMNLVDAPKPKFFDKSLIMEAMDFVDKSLGEGKKVLIHCNQGESRSPSLAMLYLATRAGAIPNDSFAAAERAFKKLYRNYSPASGIRGHLQEYWEQYVAEGR